MGLPMNVENLEAESLEKNTLVQRRIPNTNMAGFEH